MITVCDGWHTKHPRVTLKNTGPEGGVSHGMCPDCEAEFQRAITARTAPAATTYADYLRSPLDPRD
jgi:hypothetical protein